MNAQEINGKRVVFRDKIPAVFGWKVIGAMNKFTTAMQKRRDELLAQIPDSLPDSIAMIPSADVIDITYNSLSWDSIVALIRGAVQEWEFDGDLSSDKCCDNLDTLTELFPLITESRSVFFGADLSGEVAGGSTNT